MRGGGLRSGLLVSVMSLLSACASWDMQGHDPRVFYDEHPIENKIEMRTQAYRVVFEPDGDALSEAERNQFYAQINHRSMLSVQEIVIDVSPANRWQSQRQAYLEKMLSHMGYHDGNIRFQISDAVPSNVAVIHMTYAQVVPPRCPDWRKSPSNNYSNSPHANFGCATTVNLGQMVADPRDLQRGTGELPPTLSERGDRFLRQFRTGESEGGGSNPLSAGGSDGGGGDEAANGLVE